MASGPRHRPMWWSRSAPGSRSMPMWAATMWTAMWAARSTTMWAAKTTTMWTAMWTAMWAATARSGLPPGTDPVAPGATPVALSGRHRGVGQEPAGPDPPGPPPSPADRPRSRASSDHRPARRSRPPPRWPPRGPQPPPAPSGPETEPCVDAPGPTSTPSVRCPSRACHGCVSSRRRVDCSGPRSRAPGRSGSHAGLTRPAGQDGLSRGTADRSRRRSPRPDRRWRDRAGPADRCRPGTRSEPVRRRRNRWPAVPR